MSDIDSTYIESFNARHLDPAAVAKSFVPSVHFDQLCGNHHSVLVGPRGSGKTTLLKMLQPKAIEAWDHPQAQKYRRKVSYSGVFIPADISWGAQIEALGYGELSLENHRTLSIAAFTTHVLRALIETMLVRVARNRDSEHRPFRRVKLNNDDESNFVLEVSNAWKINPTIPSLLSLKHALRARLSDIRLLGNQGALEDQNLFKNELKQKDFLHLHFIDAVSAAIELFNDYAGEGEAKWALLFDELETAPGWIQDELIRALRSVDEKLLIKLAISPISSNARLILETSLSPAPGQDLRQVRLWYPEKTSGYAFCKDLWDFMLTAKGFSPIDPEKALGTSYFDPERESKGQKSTVYGPSGAWTERFKSLAARDRSFHTFLRIKGLPIEQIDTASVPMRDKITRKVAPIVAVREYFLANDIGETPAQRSRKAETLYTGAKSLFAITEANPRWFIGIVEKLLSETPEHARVIPRPIQAAEIEATSQRFLAMLRTSPVKLSAQAMQHNGIVGLLERIGTYFYRRAVLEKFNPEPPMSFIVDDAVDEPTLSMLETALNRGAILYIPHDESELALTSLRGKRFRLSYMLASTYGLPLRLGKATSLSTILANPDGERKQGTIPSLFDGMQND